jgi:hypothetical protein
MPELSWGDMITVRFDKAELDAWEAQREGILNRVGHCLQAWSGVEMNMGNLFLSLHDALRPNNSLLRSVFDGIISFEARLSMLQLSVTHDRRHAPVFVEKWNALYNKLQKSVRKRNEIAHFSVSVETQECREAKLYPFWQTPGAKGRAPLTAENLKEREQSFLDLSSRIIRFVEYVETVRGRFELSLLPVTDPVHLLENPFVPTREIPRDPPLSSEA